MSGHLASVTPLLYWLELFSVFYNYKCIYLPKDILEFTIIVMSQL